LTAPGVQGLDSRSHHLAYFNRPLQNINLSRIIVRPVLLKQSQLGITPEAFFPCELEYKFDEQVMTFGKVARLVDLRIEKERRIGLSE
jgi:hypothetical protein